MTLQSIKQDSLLIARCFLGRSYPRVLNSNAHLSSVTWEVTGWLARNLFAFLDLTGVNQFAWVHSAGLRGRNMAEDIVQQFPQELELALFADIEQAVTWLQKTGVDYQSGCAGLPRSVEKEAQLAQFIKKFSEKLRQAGVAG